MTREAIKASEKPGWPSRQEVEDFLYHEAQLLDEWRLEEWLTLFTEDARYLVPTTDLQDPDPKANLVSLEDDMFRLRGRVTRLLSRWAHREYPWSRTRRIITNVQITGVEGDDIHIRANYIVYRMRREEVAPFVGWYEYTLRRVDGGLKIRYRKAVLDLERLSEHGSVSIIV